MRNFFLRELRDCSRDISRIEKKGDRKRENDRLAELLETMVELSNIARSKGLLALEEAAFECRDIFGWKYLKKMILLIVDGWAPEQVEETSLVKYFSANLSGYEALHYLVMLVGVLDIQAGENPRLMEEKLLAMLPEDAADMYCQKRDRAAEAETEPCFEADYDIVEKYYVGDIAAIPGDEYYSQIKIGDYVIRTLDDAGIQRVLREVDSHELAVTMQGLSGEARRRLFTNLSRRFALMLAEDMSSMEPVTVSDAAKAITKIFNITIRLKNCGELLCSDSEALKVLSNIFDDAF